MVRQDKIAYLLAGFTGLRKDPLYPEDTLMECLIKTILSQGTRDQNRDIAMDRLMSSCNTWEAVYSLNKSELTSLIRPAGLASRKSETIKCFLKWCKQEFGEFDVKSIETWETKLIINSLVSIPGIGVKTAAIFCCFSLKRSVFPVDIHVYRILIRIGVISNQLKPNQVFDKVDSYIPYGKDYFLHCHLIEHGRSICRKDPSCNHCMFSEHCDYNLKKNYWAIV